MKRLPPRRNAFTLIELIVVVCVVGVLVALLLPSATRSREAARRSTCKNHLKQIGVALHAYHDVHGSFPPAYTVDANAGPLHGWRTVIVPHLDEGSFFNSIDLTKRWDNPANAAARERPLPVYSCPSTPYEQGMTTYLGVAAPGGLFAGSATRTIPNVTDGTANTLAVVEVAPDRAVHWMSPRDEDGSFLFRLKPKQHEFAHMGGFHALLLDGHVRFINDNIDPTMLRALTTIAGGENVGDF